MNSRERWKKKSRTSFCGCAPTTTTKLWIYLRFLSLCSVTQIKYFCRQLVYYEPFDLVYYWMILPILLVGYTSQCVPKSNFPPLSKLGKWFSLVICRSNKEGGEMMVEVRSASAAGISLFFVPQLLRPPSTYYLCSSSHTSGIHNHIRHRTRTLTLD